MVLLVGSYDSGSYQAKTIGEGLTSCPFYDIKVEVGLMGGSNLALKWCGCHISFSLWFIPHLSIKRIYDILYGYCHNLPNM